MNEPFKIPTNTGISSPKSLEILSTITVMASSISDEEIKGLKYLS
jgi:hypothetical protein